jgi:hypothetical protein
MGSNLNIQHYHSGYSKLEAKLASLEGLDRCPYVGESKAVTSEMYAKGVYGRPLVSAAWKSTADAGLADDREFVVWSKVEC